MNLYYAIYGDEAKIIDENENKTTREVTENLQESLIKENEIEEMENRLYEAKNIINFTKKELKSNKKWKFLGPLVGIAIATICSSILALVRWDLSYLFSLDTFEMSVYFTLLGSTISFVSQTISKKYKKELHTAELQVYFLEKEIPLKKQELEELKNNDNKLEPPIEQLGMEKVDDRETLLQLRKYLDKLKQYGEILPELADKFAEGLWSEEDRENVQNDGINAELFEQYLYDYNTRKLMKGKRAS